jgi:hypothetical protein
MMKRNRIFLIVLILLGSLTFWFVINKGKGTIKEELRNFSYKDTAAVVKVFMADKKGRQVLLEKQNDGTWLVNKKTPARPDAIKIMLATIHDVEVRSPVGKAAYNNIIKAIAANAVKVEIYDVNGHAKTYYVGSPTQDQLGTFMYLENSTVPFITHIPGFNGYLTPRYSTKEDDWKVKNVFHLSQGMLDELQVIDREQPGYSFRIKNNGNNSYSLFDEKGKQLEGASQDKIINYLDYYGMINYEMEETSLSKSQVDSLMHQQPFRTIKLTYTDGKNTMVNFWKRPVTGSTAVKENEAGTPFKFDVDRMTAQIEGDNRLIVVQYFSFEKLFRKTADFLNSKAAK